MMAGGIGPQIPPEIAAKLGIRTNGSAGDADDAKQHASDTESSVIGPAMPPPGVLMPRSSSGGVNEKPSASEQPSDIDSDDDGLIGPSAGLAGYTETDAQQQTLSTINQRLEKAESSATADAADANKREEWMLVPPTAESANKRGSAALFDKSWTETPAEKRERREKEARKNRRSDKAKEEEEEETPEMRRRRLDDEEKARWVEEYNREQRPKSLLELHLENSADKKRRRKEKKRDRGDDVGAEGDEDDKWKRRRFDRSRDLAAGKSDGRRRRELLESLGHLSDKYGPGKGGSFA